MHKAVFLDRDGTINVEKNYVHEKEDFEFIPGSIEAIGLLNSAGYKVFVITNQAGVARGYFHEKDVILLHKWMNSELKKHDAFIDEFLFCPHHETSGVGEYRCACGCRKPKPGMILDLIERYSIEPGSSYTIGDKESDLLAGKRAGTKTILVKTGYGSCESDGNADFIVEDLLHAVEQVVLPNTMY